MIWYSYRNSEMSFRQTALTGALRSGKTDLVFSNHGHEKEERKKKKKCRIKVRLKLTR